MTVGTTAGRMRASAGLVLAVATMVIVTCTLVAAILVYRDAIVDAGVRSSIDNASATSRTLDVTTRAPASDTPELFDALGGDVLGPETQTFDTAVFATSGSFRVADPPNETEPDTGTTVITRLAAFEADDLWIVVDGDLEVRGSGPEAPMPTALHRDAAELLGLEVGSLVRLDPPNAGRLEPVDLRVVAVLEPADDADGRWFGRPLGRLGVTTSGSFTEVGPFFVDPEGFATVEGDASFTARFSLDAERLDAASVDEIVAAIDGAPTTLGSALAPLGVRVESDLGELLRDTDTSMRSTGAVVAAILLQLAAVALYGLGMAATVLVASRRTERVLLHSRGISTGQVARDSLFEAAAIALPAAIVGPFLATALVHAVGTWGPVAATGLDLRSTVSGAAFAASALAAVIAAGVIAWPAIAATRVPTTEPSEPRSDPFLRRTGLDIVLFVAAVLGLWQLQRTGSVSSSAEPGARTSVDPVLVLAPTLGVAAAALLAVRLLALAANGLERLGVRSRRLAPALAGREASRSGARRNRPAILVVVTVAVASFALIHAVSWETSQRDQADAEVGADLVAGPDHRPDAGIAQEHLAAAYRDIVGVASVTPIDDWVVDITPELRSIPLVALDATRFTEFSRTRPDVVASPEAIGLLSAPTDLRGVALPQAGGEVTATISISATTTEIGDRRRFPTATEVDVALVVSDEFGTLRRLPGDRSIATGPTPDGSVTAATVSFGRIDDSADPDRPTRLVEIEIVTPVPFIDFQTIDLDLDDDGTDDITPLEIPSVRTNVEVSNMAVNDDILPVGDAAWSPIVPPPARSTVSAPTATASGTNPTVIEFVIDAGTSARRQTSAQFRFLTADADSLSDAVPTVAVLATPALLDALGAEIGTPVQARLGALRAQLVITGTTEVVPFAADQPLALLADHATMTTAGYLATGARSIPDRWAFVAQESQHRDIDATLQAAPFVSVEVADRWAEAERRTRDPVLVGLTGSLLMAIGAVAVVALVGLAMTAVTGARDRRASHAVLRAVGAPRSELRRSLVREIVPLGVLATAIGLLTGAVIASLVLTALTGDRDGSDAIPPPEFVVPWFALAALITVTLAAIAFLPFATGRLLRGVRPADELRIGDQR